jgi:hypothetical protein
MRRPQLVRDGTGQHLVWGEWMVSLRRPPQFWSFDHVTRYAALGATQIDVWLGFGLRLERVRSKP